MKVQCGVCGKDEAAVFCTADEAALCGGCDHRVHHANKIASKHQRFSLLSPSSKDFPLCDVCQDKRAFLFCHQDRATLCRDCDVSIHTANEDTQKHIRFLLTGVKLSAASTLYNSEAKPRLASVGSHKVPDFKIEASSVNKPPVLASISSAETPTYKEGSCNASLSAAAAANPVNGVTSSISEYLIEMLPGWHFEDFLNSCTSSFGFCKNDHDGLLPLVNGDDMMKSSMASENLGLWAPRAPMPTSSSATNHLPSAANNGLEETTITRQPAAMKHSKRWSDNSFAVPQISPPPSGLKRSRHFH